MGRRSTEAGRLVTKLIARICDSAIGTNGSVTNMDRAFDLGNGRQDRYVPDGRSSDHFHGRVQMLETVFTQYFRMLKANCGNILISSVRLFRLLLTIEKQEAAFNALDSVGVKDRSLVKCLNQDLIQSTSAQDAVVKNLGEILSLPNFRFFICTVAVQRVQYETLPPPQEKAMSLLSSSFTYSCLTTTLALVKDDLHRFLVNNVFPQVSTTSSLSVLSITGRDGFWHHIQCIERLYASFQKFIEDLPSNVKKEFVLRLSFADLDELLDDIEFTMNTIDSYDHQTRFGIKFVFDEMGLSFQPPCKMQWSVL